MEGGGPVRPGRGQHMGERPIRQPESLGGLGWGGVAARLGRPRRLDVLVDVVHPGDVRRAVAHHQLLWGDGASTGRRSGQTQRKRRCGCTQTPPNLQPLKNYFGIQGGI